MDAKRASKNRDAAQQGFLISVLLRLGYDVTVNCLYKKAFTTRQLFTIRSITRDDQVVFDFSTLPKPSGDFKEKRQCIDALTNNAIIRIICSNGARVIERRTRGVSKKHLVNTIRIASAKVMGDEFSMEQIEQVGIECNDAINRLSSFTHGSFTLKSTDPMASLLTVGKSDNTSTY